MVIKELVTAVAKLPLGDFSSPNSPSRLVLSPPAKTVKTPVNHTPSKMQTPAKTPTKTPVREIVEIEVAKDTSLDLSVDPPKDVQIEQVAATSDEPAVEDELAKYIDGEFR